MWRPSSKSLRARELFSLRRSELDTPLSLLFGRAMGKAHPVYASMELTYNCNLACRFCYNPVQRQNQRRTTPPPGPAKPPLTLEEILCVLDQLRDMGVLYLTLTGGEPILHPDFWAIARAAKERSFALRIFTNGASLTEASVARLAELGPYCLELSLHGATAATAEALTQVKGSFDRQMRALGWLKERGLRVYLKVVVTRLVEKELEAVKALGERFGFPVYFDPVLTPSDDGQDYPLDLRASDDAIRRLYSASGLNMGNSPFEREPGQYNCGVGTGTLHLTPYGDLQPCIQWKQAVGNVRERSIRSIWEESALLQEVRAISRQVPAVIVARVKEHAYCFSCPGLSRLRTGDPLRPDEQYLRVAQIRREAAESERHSLKTRK